MGSYRYRSLIEGLIYLIYYRSLIEALYTLNSPPVVSFNLVLSSNTSGLMLDDTAAGIAEAYKVLVQSPEP